MSKAQWFYLAIVATIVHCGSGIVDCGSRILFLSGKKRVCFSHPHLPSLCVLHLSLALDSNGGQTLETLSLSPLTLCAFLGSGRTQMTTFSLSLSFTSFSLTVVKELQCPNTPTQATDDRIWQYKEPQNVVHYYYYHFFSPLRW